jgi:DNA invertase Pin-like site-specific DNA recombinase
MAEDERKRIKDRQMEGIRIALNKGVKFGRKKIEINEKFKSVYVDWKCKKNSNDLFFYIAPSHHFHRTFLVLSMLTF